MKKKYKIISIMLIALILFIGLSFAIVKQEKKKKYKATLSAQIIETENNLKIVNSGVKACGAVALGDWELGDFNRCLELSDLINWTRETPFYPELIDTKNELLMLVDSLEELMYQITLYDNKSGDWRGDMEIKIQIQTTKVKEEIIKTKIDLGIDNLEIGNLEKLDIDVSGISKEDLLKGL